MAKSRGAKDKFLNSLITRSRFQELTYCLSCFQSVICSVYLPPLTTNPEGVYLIFTLAHLISFSFLFSFLINKCVPAEHLAFDSNPQMQGLSAV